MNKEPVIKSASEIRCETHKICIDQYFIYNVKETYNTRINQRVISMYISQMSDVYYEDSIEFCEYSQQSEYTEQLLNIVNKYSKEFYNKEYFTRWEGELYNSNIILFTKAETWNMEYLRNGDTLHSWKGFIIATLIPIFGWYFVLYSMYEAVRLYFKHKGD